MKKIKKDITFVYMDKADYQSYYPIYQEALKRGYTARLTQKVDCKCEIGFYCQHKNYPWHSKMSVIILYDLLQEKPSWPDYWFIEPWYQYDIGFLPNSSWADMWEKNSQFFYARPKRAVYLAGWPKSDKLAQINREEILKSIVNKTGLDINKRTVLYAPAYENDDKEDDFINSLSTLGCNMLIKQAFCDPNHSELYKRFYDNIERKRRQHEGLPSVCILDPSTNIMDAIAISDILVTDESSTMGEAAMMGIPAVSVSDWPIPNLVNENGPKSYPDNDYEYVIKTTRAGLKECISIILDNYSEYREKQLAYRNTNYPYFGITAKRMMDIVDAYVENVDTKCFKPLHPLKKKKMSLSKYFAFRNQYVIKSLYFLSVRYRFFAILRNLYYRIFKHIDATT